MWASVVSVYVSVCLHRVSGTLLRRGGGERNSVEIQNRGKEMSERREDEAADERKESSLYHHGSTCEKLNSRKGQFYQQTSLFRLTSFK